MKKWLKITIFLIIFVLFCGAGYFFYVRYYENQQANLIQSKNATTTIQNPTNLTSQTTTQTTIPKSPLYFPISNYTSRLTARWFGKLVTSSDRVSPCGAAFSGFHDGDDLETTTAEQNIDIPVYAISDSTVRQIGNVSGYGGLLVLETTINGQDYTIYYGHMNLASASIKVGDTVVAGQKLANLGMACSVETDGERKHLHFAMHKGTAVDVRGYVPSISELASWINPKDFLLQGLAV